MGPNRDDLDDWQVYDDYRHRGDGCVWAAMIAAVCLAVLAFWLASVFTARPAAAAPVLCGARAGIVAALERDYGERQAATGLIDEKQVLELHAGPRGTWTALIARVDGTACIVAAGSGWTMILRQTRETF